MINLLITVALGAICFYIGILYQNPHIILCGIAVIFMLLLSILEVLYRRYTMKCMLEIPISMVEEDQPAEIRIRVKNQGFVASGKLKATLAIYPSGAKKSKKNRFVIEHGYKGEESYGFQVKFGEPGYHRLRLTKVRIYSLTRMVSINIRLKEENSITIMPSLRLIGTRISEHVRNFTGEADVFDDIRPGHDPSETLEIRPYREKDKMQSVHWKLSAKSEDLLVKETSLPLACSVVLLLDMNQLKQSSAFLELMAAVSFSLLDARVPHYVAWYSKRRQDMLRARIDDEESFYMFLATVLPEIWPTKEWNIREAYKQKYRSEYYLYELVVNPQLELYKNEELLVRMEPKQMDDECKKLEILL